MSNIDEMFAGMEKAESFGAGQYFKGEGKFRLRTKSYKRNVGYKGTFFIVEFDVIESNSVEDPAGVTRSWTVNLDPKNRYAYGDIKGLMMAILGIDPDKHKDPNLFPAEHAQATTMVKAALDPNYAASLKPPMGADDLIGMDVALDTFKKPTAPKPPSTTPGTFTKHVWSVAPTG